MSRSALIRHAVQLAIDEASINEEYTFNAFVPRETHLPSDRLEALDEPSVWIVGLGGDEQSLVRGRAFEADIPVQVLLKQQVNAADVAAIDALDALLDQLKDTCRNVNGEGAGYRFTHLRNEAMKDPSGLPFNFVLLREADVYEGAFLAVFKLTVSG